MNPVDIKKVLKVLAAILRCPVCGFGYNFEKMRVIEHLSDQEGGSMVAIHSDCKKCKASVVFNIGVLEDELFSAGSVTDLTYEDARWFKTKPAISPDDCLTIHKHLKGSAEELFEKLKISTPS